MQQDDAYHNQQNTAELHKTQSFRKQEVAEARYQNVAK